MNVFILEGVTALTLALTTRAWLIDICCRKSDAVVEIQPSVGRNTIEESPINLGCKNWKCWIKLPLFRRNINYMQDKNF